MQDEALLSTAACTPHTVLLPFERQIVNLIAAGYSNKERARRIGIGEPALRPHVAVILQKLGVSNEFELVLLALHDRLIDPD